MATPTLTSHQLPGRLGPILVDVRATQRTSPQPAVIVHHGFKGFKDYAFIPVFAERLARGGFTAVTASVSGSGVDEAGDFTLLDRFAANTYSIELDDLGALLRALHDGELGTVPPSSTGLVGHSRGGGMGLCFARESPQIAAVATWAGIGQARRHSDRELAIWRKLGTIEVENQRTKQMLPLHFNVVEDWLKHERGRLDIPAAAAALGRPWLQIHGTADGTVLIDEARALSRFGRGPHFGSHFITGADHTFGTKHPWAGPSSHSDREFDLTMEFVSRHLR